jgi:hypothetical protein
LDAVPEYQKHILPEPPSGKSGAAFISDIGALTAPLHAKAMLGEALTEVGLNLHKQADEAIADYQFNQFQLSVNTKWNQAQIDIANNPDPMKDKEILERFIADVEQNDRPKVTHPLAINNAALFWQQRTKTRSLEGKEVAGDWVRAVELQSAVKAGRNAAESFRMSEDLAIKNGNVEWLRSIYDNAEKSGYFPDHKIREERQKWGEQEILTEDVFSDAIRAGNKEAGYKVIDGSDLPDKEKATLGNRLDDYWAGRVKQGKDTNTKNVNLFYDNSISKLLKGELTPDDLDKSILDLQTNKDAKEKWQGYLKGFFGDAPQKTTPEGYSSITNAVLDFSMLKTSRQAAYDSILTARFIDKNITDDDLAWAMNKIKEPYPKHIVADLESVLVTNRAEIKHEGYWPFETAADIERSQQVNTALLNWVDSELANKKTPTMKEMYQKSAELRVGNLTIEQTKQPPQKDLLHTTSAPLVEFDSYWKNLDDESKMQIWQIYKDPVKVKIAVKRLQEKYPKQNKE